MEPTLIADCGSHALKYGLWRKPRKGTPSSLVFQTGPSHYAESNDGWLDTISLVEQLHKIAEDADLAANQFQLLLAVPPLLPQRCKEFLTKAAFETLNVKRLSFSYTPVLSLVASGVTSGLVVDVGHNATTVCPVIQATPIPLFTTVLNGQGGKAVQQYLRTALKQQNTTAGHISDDIVHTFQQRTQIHDSTDNGSEESNSGEGNNTVSSVTLPDGSSISIAQRDLRDAGQCLLRGTSPAFVAQLCAREVLSIPTQSTFTPSYLLTGGASLTSGYAAYIGQAFSSDSNNKALPHLTTLSCRDPVQAVWTGASIFVQLSSFQSMSMDKAMYDECGPRDSLRYSSTDIR